MHSSKTLRLTLFASIMGAFASIAAMAGTVDYVKPTLPYEANGVFQTPFAPPTTGPIIVPILTWGPDGHIVTANGGLPSNSNSALAKALGVPVEVRLSDIPDEQVKRVISGQPFFRGTLAQVALVNEGLKKVNPGLELVVIYQLSWSTGADGFAAVGVQSIAQLKGKAIVGQLNGPHMLDMVPKMLEDAGLKPGDVELRYVKDISNSATESVAVATDPANALRNDSTLAGAAMIGPDLSAITSGEGKGAVRNSRILFTTKTADHVIADVLAVRSDYFEKNEAALKQFVNALLAEANSYADDLDNVSKKQAADKAKLAVFKKKVTPLAGIFLGDPALVPDYIGWIGLDSKIVGVRGNVEFFQSSQNPVGFDATLRASQDYLVKAGFIRTATPLRNAGWDWSNLGTSVFITTKASTPVFADAQAVRQAASKNTSNELLRFAFQFPAAESALDWRKYEPVFDNINEKVNRYGGAVVQIRGHADPFLYNFFAMKLSKGETTYTKGNQPPAPIPPLESVKNANTTLSYTRAAAIKAAYAAYLREKLGKGANEIDLSRFDIRGMGTEDPVYPNPITPEQRTANMRGEIVIINVESELPTDFDVNDLK
jgi:NitT/TauT family transport system substrate-binding protein